MQQVNSHDDELEQEFYITECTWMRKHGWRTPEWKLIIALEPDFHFKPEIELYNLKDDPNELKNLVDLRPDMVSILKEKMDKWIAKKKKRRPAWILQFLSKGIGTVSKVTDHLNHLKKHMTASISGMLTLQNDYRKNPDKLTSP